MSDSGSTMYERFSEAATEGAVLGLKWSIACALVLSMLSWLLGDYNTVRQRALNGQQAFEYIRQVQAQQQQATAKPAPGTQGATP